ncbi:MULTISPECIES: hypothetical protein [unclassified Streptomyces]|uniref:hypothetical protein n=1 Tax=unclassified Streptomyces TaxID=2593676 RepID=UPI002948BC2A|nr:MULTISPECIES: hypothetical protein [unclassified Streptomyces]
MVGKFHAGEEEATRAGVPVPPAPVSFLAVRAAVRRRDPRLLQATPGLAAALAVAVDDGRDVLAHAPHDWQEIRTWTKRSLPPAKPSSGSAAGSATPSRPAS